MKKLLSASLLTMALVASPAIAHTPEAAGGAGEGAGILGHGTVADYVALGVGTAGVILAAVLIGENAESDGVLFAPTETTPPTTTTTPATTTTTTTATTTT